MSCLSNCSSATATPVGMWGLRDVDIPLTEKGVMEALAGGKAVSHINFDIIFTSRLVRSKQTALIAMTQVGVVSSVRLVRGPMPITLLTMLSSALCFMAEPIPWSSCGGAWRVSRYYDNTSHYVVIGRNKLRVLIKTWHESRYYGKGKTGDANRLRLRAAAAQALEQAACRMIPVYADQALNERCYGDLQVRVPPPSLDLKSSCGVWCGEGLSKEACF